MDKYRNIRAWTSLYKGPLLVHQWLAQGKLTPTEYEAVIACIHTYRERLGGVSWFIKCLNEPLARQANKEQVKRQALQKFELPIKPLATFEGHVSEHEQVGILFGLEDYLQLVNTTGRIIREDKRGTIALHLSPILERLTIINNPEDFDSNNEYQIIIQASDGEDATNKAFTVELSNSACSFFIIKAANGKTAAACL